MLDLERRAGGGWGAATPRGGGISLALLGALLLAGPTTANAKFEVFLDSAIRVDPVAETVTLPLRRGTAAGGSAVWYVVLDASDRDAAERLGVNWSPKLANALGTAAVQRAGGGAASPAFPGTVDFRPALALQPGSPAPFPPAVANPGSVGDAAYSPLLTTDGRLVLNAPHVANASGQHDKVVAIDFQRRQVTLRLTAGFYHGNPILYLSTEASDRATAAIEEATFAPNMNAAPGLASGDPATSARAAIIPVVNGATGVANPNRQGLASAVLGEGSPLNITEIHPRNRGKIPTYSPLWDVHPVAWTARAVAAGERVRLDHHEDVIDGLEEGRLVSAGAGPRNPDLGGLRAGGFIVNCPIVVLE